MQNHKRFFTKCPTCGKHTREIVRDGEDVDVRPCPNCFGNEYVHKSDRLSVPPIAAPPPVFKNGKPLPTFPDPPDDYENEFTNAPACGSIEPTECGKFTNEHSFPLYEDPPFIPATNPFPFPCYSEDITRGRNLGDIKFSDADGTTRMIDESGVHAFTIKLNPPPPLSADKLIETARELGADLSVRPIGHGFKCAARFLGFDADDCGADADVLFVTRCPDDVELPFPSFTLEAGLCYRHANRLQVGDRRDVSIGFTVTSENTPAHLAEIETMNLLKDGGFFKDLSNDQLLRLVRANGSDVDDVARAIAEENAPKRAEIQKIVNILSTVVRRKKDAWRARVDQMAALSTEDIEGMSVCKKQK